MTEYREDLPEIRAEMLVYYENPVSGEAEVGKINFLNGEVVLKIEGKSAELLPFTRDQLKRIIRSMINVPVMVSRMRNKLLPERFSQLFPGSVEHIERLMTQSGPFRLVSVSI